MKQMSLDQEILTVHMSGDHSKLKIDIGVMDFILTVEMYVE